MTSKSPKTSTSAVTIELRDAVLEGDLTLPEHPRGIILFAHGSGNSRRSPRNRFLAAELNADGFATLLFDLLTPAEEQAEAYSASLRFDIDILAERLSEATEWLLVRYPEFHERVGYLGASTGAAAALVAAADRKGDVFAVAVRGGRPDLAGASLPHVRAPVKMIVGANDAHFAALNEEARAFITAPCEITIIPGASHLFEEPGTWERVAGLAADWFSTHLPAASGAYRETETGAAAARGE